MVYIYKKSFAAGEVLRAADVNTYLTSSKNLLLNGDFSINQRSYVSATNLASGTYGFDRWKSNYTNTTLTFTAAPQGQMVTINSGGGIKQVVEQGNIVSESYTLSWDGTAQGRIYKSGATAPSYASSPITVSLDGTGNVDVEFTASGGTKTLHNVQLEIGSSASPFSRAADTIQGELAACQRYYYRSIGDSGVYTGHATGLISGYAGGIYSYYLIPLPVTMRVAPTSIDSSAFGTFATSDGVNVSVNTALPALSTNNSSRNNAFITATHGGLTSYRPSWFQANNTTSSYIGFNAEL